MTQVSVVEEKGSFRLVACDGRFAVVEARAGQVFGLPDDADLPSAFSVDYVRAWKR